MNNLNNLETIIKLNNISYNRNKKIILNKINFKLSSENFILMTGQNGSGKSTLLQIIAGLLKPDSFDLYYKQGMQRKKSWSAAKKYLRQKFCYLHQTPYLFSGTVYDNIAYGLKQQGLNRSEIDNKVKDALKLIDLQHLCNRKSHALSGGEKQRVAIARSWVIQPAFILLDEPFANMDKHSRSSTYDIINQLKEDNIGIVLTSHDPHSGELAFNRHMHLHLGNMIEKNLKHITHNT